MNDSRVFILLAAIAGLLATASIVLLIFYIRQKRKIRQLTADIDAFITSGILTELSTSDDALAQLQTNICDLENRMMQERSYNKKTAENNAAFISDISHQLKTPLAGLRLYCEMAHNQAPDSYTKKELALIEKMEKLIFNVLKLEKLRSDTYAMNFTEYDAAEIALDLKKEFLHLFPNKIITVSGSGLFRCDREWLREALGNVIKNACEHTADNGKISVIIEQSDKTVSVTVEDNGGGVPEEDCTKLFERFYRAQKAAPDSAGIGLAITKAIVVKHHGTVSAENSKEGLRINMCFPIIDANTNL